MPNYGSSHMPESSSSSIHTSMIAPGVLGVKIIGRLDSLSTGSIWRETNLELDRTSPKQVIVDASEIEYCDGSGIGYLFELRRRLEKGGGELSIRGLHKEFQQLLDLFKPSEFEEPPEIKPESFGFFEKIGQSTGKICEEARALVEFVGETGTALLKALLNPKQVRWKDALLVAETAGVNALPVITLIGFLMGLIMAFQAAIPMRQFGAVIYVANLVGLSMVRELGPLMTAIVLAGRSGSAFAAELGTMKVNEEIDALVTMGLDPVKFLVVTRLLAAVIMTPLLTLFADLIGVLGGSIVLISLGYSLATYFRQIFSTVTYVDLLGGLFKSIVFGLLVAGIGCLRGLQTEIGASAVGESTTRAVVGGIVLIVAVDGIFSVVYYYLGI
ncbi:MAG: MlaE family lipid ABC transporter permease subunit [Desulfobacterales bacterium]|nr:MlaE family lipid ABC transporter permease subunit [Desulfobacterales bacterium]